MPGKARRVASRQAQLSRRRKRQQKGASPMPPLEVVADETDGNHAAVTEPPVVEAPAPAPVRPSPVAERRPSTTQSPARLRARGELPSANSYIGAELRRIVVMASVVLAAIIVLGVLL